MRNLVFNRNVQIGLIFLGIIATFLIVNQDVPKWPFGSLIQGASNIALLICVVALILWIRDTVLTTIQVAGGIAFWVIAGYLLFNRDVATWPFGDIIQGYSSIVFFLGAAVGFLWLLLKMKSSGMGETRIRSPIEEDAYLRRKAELEAEREAEEEVAEEETTDEIRDRAYSRRMAELQGEREAEEESRNKKKKKGKRGGSGEVDLIGTDDLNRFGWLR